MTLTVRAYSVLTVQLATAKSDSFRQNEFITIGSSYRLLPGWGFETRPPSFGALDLLGISASTNVELCIFD